MTDIDTPACGDGYTTGRTPCPTPTGSVTPTPEPSISPSVAPPSSGASVAPSPSHLPLTGPGGGLDALVVVGTLAVLVGAAAVLAVRGRRRYRFRA